MHVPNRHLTWCRSWTFLGPDIVHAGLQTWLTGTTIWSKTIINVDSHNCALPKTELQRSMLVNLQANHCNVMLL